MMRKLHCVSGDRPLTALLNGLVRLVYEAVIAPMRRRARRRADARELACLADHLLRDIGMTRAQVLAAAFGPVTDISVQIPCAHAQGDLATSCA